MCLDAWESNTGLRPLADVLESMPDGGRLCLRGALRLPEIRPRP